MMYHTIFLSNWHEKNLCSNQTFVFFMEIAYNTRMGYMSMFKPRKKQKHSLWDDEEDQWDDDSNGESEEEEPQKPAFPLSAVPTVAVAISISLGLNFMVLGVFALIAYAVTDSTSILHKLVLCIGLLVLVTGCIAFPLGVRRYQYLARFFRYIGFIERRTEVSVLELAEKSDLETKTVQQDLHKAFVDQLLPEGHMNEDRTMLYLTNEAYEKAGSP